MILLYKFIATLLFLVFLLVPLNIYQAGYFILGKYTLK